MSTPTPQTPSSAAPQELPKTWRPLGVRVAAIFFGAVLLVVVVVAGLTLNEETRAKWTPFQFWTLVALGLLFATVFWGMARSRVTASVSGLEVTNGFRTHTYTWDQIQDIRLAKGQPWAVLDLGEDEHKSVLALQSTDGDRARDAGRVIYRLVHAA